MTSATGLTRYALLLDQQAVKTVDRLQSTYRFKNRADVYDLAIRVLTWVTEQEVGGLEVGRAKDGQFQPLHLGYALDKAAWRE